MNRLAPFALLSVLFFAFGCEEKATVSSAVAPAPVPPVKITDIVEGTGPGAEEADLVILEYTGIYPESDLEFETNTARDPDTDEALQPPIAVVIGRTAVIEGWHEGLVGIKNGGERLLEVPWQKAYGEEGRGSIGPKQNLNFIVKVLDMVRYEEAGIYDIEDLVEGQGPGVVVGDRVAIHYRGTYANGIRFDSSYERGDKEAGGEAAVFRVGSQVIKGIDDGLLGMKVGGKRWLRIPPSLAYGSVDTGVIQGDQILFFVIELLAIE